jgi:hypothetical protein
VLSSAHVEGDLNLSVFYLMGRSPFIDNHEPPNYGIYPLYLRLGYMTSGAPS